MSLGCLLMGHSFRRWGNWLVCKDCGKCVRVGGSDV